MPNQPDWQSLPFPEAIAYFKKRIPLPTERWDELLGQHQSVAFTIAGIMKISILKDIQDALTKALEEGTTFDTFKTDFTDIMTKKGWNPGFSPYRLELIFGQAIRTAYSYGRWQQMEDPDLKRRRPYRQWVHRDSSLPRDSHLQQDGKVYPADDPIWKAIFPPPFSCRCTAYALSDRDLKREGLTVSTAPPLSEIAEKGFDKGFPKNLEEHRQQLLGNALDKLSPHLRKLLKEEVG